MIAELHDRTSAFVARVVEDIKCGLLKPEEKLLPERQLSESLSLSRTTVRRGVKKLLDTGIIYRQGKGARIHADAIRIIESAHCDKNRLLYVVIPERQYGNTILQDIFSAISSRVASQCKITVLSEKRLSTSFVESLCSKDSMLVIGTVIPDAVLDEIKKKLCFLLLLNVKNDKFNYAAPDNYAGGRLMAQILYESGHRHIGALFGDCRLDEEFGERYLGARDYLKEQGIELVLCDKVTQEPGEDRFEQHCSLIRRMRNEHGFSALICPYDAAALTVIDAVISDGGKVPDDLSLVAFDDQIYAGFTEPGLTTLRYPVEVIAETAANAISKAMKGEPEPLQKMIEPILIKRDSITIIK
jgi:DNA-binding LacI/PurR family transcriptional regulator